MSDPAAMADGVVVLDRGHSHRLGQTPVVNGKSQFTGRDREMPNDIGLHLYRHSVAGLPVQNNGVGESLAFIQELAVCPTDSHGVVQILNRDCELRVGHVVIVDCLGGGNRVLQRNGFVGVFGGAEPYLLGHIPVCGVEVAAGGAYAEIGAFMAADGDGNGVGVTWAGRRRGRQRHPVDRFGSIRECQRGNRSSLGQHVGVQLNVAFVDNIDSGAIRPDSARVLVAPSQSDLL